ncbi:MAG: IS4 family transposase, partial [Desulfurivibrionaceae bacterium]
MYTGKLIFSQVIDYLPKHTFRQCVSRYQGNRKVKNFTCLDQFLCMTFAQLTYRESLRDIEVCLRAQQSKLYHMGIRGGIARNTLSNANKIRDWRIYADLAQSLITTARELYIGEDLGIEFDNTVYALDASTIDLCLSVFPWATFRQTKAAVKLHTLLDLRGNIPSFIHISDGKLHDVNVLDILIPEPGAFYVMDRGYLDFKRLYAMTLAGAFFLIRAKSNTKFKRRYSHKTDASGGVICDQSITLTGVNSSVDYPQALRRVKYHDAASGKIFNFLTNNFTLPAQAVADLYRQRWQVELFFKWIKQHLRIKAFYGTSENAVKTQIWIAVSVYVLIAIIKKRLGIKENLYTVLQVLSVTVFEKI